jgi:hypothetical protein
LRFLIKQSVILFFLFIFAAAVNNYHSMFLIIFIYSAQMAKLVDALVSGTSISNDVQVRVLFWAQKAVQRRYGSTA